MHSCSPGDREPPSPEDQPPDLPPAPPCAVTFPPEASSAPDREGDFRLSERGPPFCLQDLNPHVVQRFKGHPAPYPYSNLNSISKTGRKAQ